MFSGKISVVRAEPERHLEEKVPSVFLETARFED
jgi:hypothetical protein